VPLDPITAQVIQNRLSGIVQEMQTNIFRTGYSTIVRESQDASCMILDANGDVVGEHVILPLHIAALPEVVRAIYKAYGDRIYPGDAFITNHPYISGVTHSIDMAVAVPVFVGERLLAFCTSIAHKSDLGGMVPGTGSGNARELFQEGIQYPPVKFTDRGQVIPEVEAILRANSRTPDVILGDIRGQVGTARLGEERLLDMVTRYGLETVLDTFADLQDKTEKRVRRVVSGWKDGVFEAEAWVDNDGIQLDRPILYHVRIEKTGDRILFDFSESADQTLGPLNVRPPLVRGCCYYAMVAMIDPELANNGGLARVVETRFRRGSVLDPVFPAPTNTYMASATAVTEAVLQAMNGLIPKKKVAGMGGVGGMVIGGQRQDGSSYVQYELIGAAYGARSGKDGASGVSVLLDNAKTAPIEVIETEFPARVRRFELITDSGGAGEYRGGLAARREYDILAPKAQLTLRGGKHTQQPFGADGGKPGRLGVCIINPGQENEQSLPSRFGGVALQKGDVLLIEKAGGGGLGLPKNRNWNALVEDVLDGYVSFEAAVSDYGADPDSLREVLFDWTGGE
jgi:N-methylhydantoinase B